MDKRFGNIRDMLHRDTSLAECIAYPVNYKPVYVKTYNLWCSLPSVGTQWSSKTYDVVYTITPVQRVLLAGAMGINKCITIAELCANYIHTDGTLITTTWLQQQMMYKGCIDWFIIKPREDVLALRQWCLHIPKKYKFVLNRNGQAVKINKPYINHGLGDFIIRNDINGRPDMRTYTVVNGIDFVTMYQLRGWEDTVISADERKKVRVLRPRSIY